MNENLRSAWITWEKQVRNRSLSRAFNASYYEFDYDDTRVVSRYSKCIIKTLRVLCRHRNGVVFVQNPSVVLAFMTLVLKPFLRYLLVVDSHNSVIFIKQKWLQFLINFINRKSEFTIVTNQNLADIIAQRGGRPLILPDPLPTFHNADSLRQLNIQGNKVFFICSWSSDEPYFEVFKAAETLPNYTFFVTGNSKGKELGYGKPLPDNVFLTGYLPDDKYHEMLATSGVILDLTTREDCLVCGAYEATALDRPFVVSDKKAIRAYFKSGCVYVENSAEGIADGIVSMTKDFIKMKAQIELARVTISDEWAELFSKAKECIFKNNS